MKEHRISGADAILCDLGLSSLQLDDAARGFRFSESGPLDMRFDRSGTLKAETIVNTYPCEKLARILKEYGEERFSGRVARAIVAARQRAPITDTRHLADVITGAIPARARSRTIDPATRSFMALRIAVNGEYHNLSALLDSLPDALHFGGRACIISFHSIEDRMVKHAFRAYDREKRMKCLTKKPERPTAMEIQSNPRARSAKLRAAEKISHEPLTKDVS